MLKNITILWALSSVSAVEGRRVVFEGKKAESSYKYSFIQSSILQYVQGSVRE